MSTLDILAHYTSINHESVVDIIQNIDSPSNGIAMQSDWHESFDNFELCLALASDVSLAPYYFSYVTHLYL